jgi:hypothetical protein
MAGTQFDPHVVPAFVAEVGHGAGAGARADASTGPAAIQQISARVRGLLALGRAASS